MIDNIQHYESPRTAVASAVTIDLDKPRWPLVEISVVQYDLDGLVIEAALAGTYLVEVKTEVNEVFESFPFNEIDATEVVTVTVGATIRQIRITPTAVAGNDVTTYKVRAIARRNA